MTWRSSISFVLALIVAAGCARHHKAAGPHLVEFSYWNASAQHVFLAGDFNSWNTTSTPMARAPGDLWKVALTVQPGHHQYKFIADGHWTSDPANTDTAPDLFGGYNSVLTVNPAPDQDGQAERKSVSAAAQRLVEAKDFAAIEKEANELRRGKVRLRQGRWKLLSFYAGLNQANYAGDDQQKWRDALTNFDEWHRRFPDSITEPVARAETLVGFAWKSRGTGWSSEVSDQGWQGMRERLKQARDVLEAGGKLPQRCPEWYSAMHAVALGQGWSRKEYDQLFEEAVAREPSYYQYYFNKAYYLTPRWFGRNGEWERFAEDACSRYDKKEGLTLYTRTAWNLSFLYGNLLRQSHIEWPKMRRGFEDILNGWPDSDWNKNNFCRFACAARDHPTAARLFSQIGERFDYDVWHSRKQFEAARRWASTAASSPAVQPRYQLGSPQDVRASALAFCRGREALLRRIR
ncbi:MAG: glycogen-binding domain-containing protein [Verrucomicrobia bacterium]|nr:glycogen-binding domain-containing protein [Verrucomicrobiota bacterium]